MPEVDRPDKERYSVSRKTNFGEKGGQTYAAGKGIWGVFQPNRGTRAYVTALAGLLSCEAEEIDLTAREERARDHVFGPEDLVILGRRSMRGGCPSWRAGSLNACGGRDPGGL